MVVAATVKLYHGDQHDNNPRSRWKVARKKGQLLTDS
jgi:hypothetical protein